MIKNLKTRTRKGVIFAIALICSSSLCGQTLFSATTHVSFSDNLIGARMGFAYGCLEYGFAGFSTVNTKHANTDWASYFTFGYYWREGVSLGILTGIYGRQTQHSNSMGAYISRYIAVGRRCGALLTLSYVYRVGVDVGIGIYIGQR